MGSQVAVWSAVDGLLLLAEVGTLLPTGTAEFVVWGP